MRSLLAPALLALGLAACGGGLDKDVEVVDLSDGELVELCEYFADQVCKNGAFPCDACHRDCSPAEVPALMRAECIRPIDVGQVQECADLAAENHEDTTAICTQGGGCVFDVFDEICGEGV